MNFLPDYKIKLKNGGEIPLLFNQKAFETFTDSLEIEFEDLYDQIRLGKTFKSKNLPNILLAGAIAFCFSNKLECSYTIADAYNWVEDFGRVITEPNVYELSKIFIANLLRVDKKTFNLVLEKITEEKEEPVVEKKKVPRKKSHGTSSKSGQRKRVSSRGR